MANVVARALLVVALFCSPCALAEKHVYLLRGWFGVFSTGIDKMAEDLRAKGIQADWGVVATTPNADGGGGSF